MDIIRWTAWNTFLALIPVAAGYAIPCLASGRGNRWLRQVGTLVLGVIWFTFLPNTCYLLTEWRHFLAAMERSNLYSRWAVGGDRDAVLLLLAYAAFFFCYSLFGMLMFAMAIRPVAYWLKRVGIFLPAAGVVFFPLIALGVYLGLVLRFNSWDLLSQFGRVWAAIVTAVSRPLLITCMLAFGGVLWLSYLAIDIWIDGFLLRWHRRFQPTSAHET